MQIPPVLPSVAIDASSTATTLAPVQRMPDALQFSSDTQKDLVIRVGGFKEGHQSEQEIARVLNATKRQDVKIEQVGTPKHPQLQISFKTWSMQANRAREPDLLVVLRTSLDYDLETCEIKNAGTLYVKQQGRFNKREGSGSSIARPSSAGEKARLLDAWKAHQEALRPSFESNIHPNLRGTMVNVPDDHPGQPPASEDDPLPSREEAKAPAVRFAPMPPDEELVNIRKAIDNNNVQAVEAALTGIDSMPAHASSLLLSALDHVRQQKDSAAEASAISELLLCHPAFDVNADAAPGTGTALDIALRKDDVKLAQRLLAMGADPLNFSIRYRSQEMRELLVFTRHRGMLYPTSAVPSVALDEALQATDLDRAKDIFKQHAQGRRIAEVWADAVDGGLLDVQRAILLLGYAATERDFRLSERNPPTDPLIRKVMNEIAHFLPELGQPVSSNEINTRGRFKGTTQAIVCSSLAKDVQECQAASIEPKEYMPRYASAESISKCIPPERYIQYRNLTFYGDGYLVPGRGLGMFRLGRFSKMLEQGQPAMHAFVLSSKHACTLNLEIDRQGEEIVYRTQMYDPDYSTNLLHSETTCLHALKLEELDSHMVTASRERYFPEGADEARIMIYVRPNDPGHLANSLTPARQPIAANRALRIQLTPAEINGPALWHMLKGGYAADILALKAMIDEVPTENRRDILSAIIPRRGTGLVLAESGKLRATLDAYNELHEHVFGPGPAP